MDKKLREIMGLIDSLIDSKIDEEEYPVELIDSLARCHSDINSYFKSKT